MTRPLPVLCIVAGLLPLVCWWIGVGLGYDTDVQVISGTLDPVHPYASATRGLFLAACWMSAAITGPPLVLGGLLWLGWRRTANRWAQPVSEAPCGSS